MNRYMSWNLIPIYDLQNNIKAFWCAVFETTQLVLANRRTRTLASIATPPNLSSFWDKVLEGLGSNELDFPFALVYSFDQSRMSLDEGAPPLPSNFKLEKQQGLEELDGITVEQDHEGIEIRFGRLLTRTKTQSRSLSVFSMEGG